MKRVFSALAVLSVALSAHAQSPTTYGPAELDQLLAPVALYPDPLIALMLPASTDPKDLSAAAQYLAANGSPAGVDSEPWDPSVKGLAHYPDVVKWMNDNLDWTQALGAAFSMQPADVMKSIQQLRAKAQAAGTLASTPQQQVDVVGDDIRIIPSQENEIFVPSYDPNEVYDLPEGSGGPYLTFGVGYPVGPWLGFECDWDDFGIWAGPWHSGWGYRRDWNNGGHGWSRWHPNPGRAHALVRGYYHPGGNLPSPRGGAFASRPPARGPAPRSPAPGLEGRNDYRGYGGAAPRTPAPSSPVFGSYGRGTQTRDFSNRGKTSRQAPVRAASPGRSAPASREESRPRH